MTSPSPQPHYKPAIDGLRALAIVAVVVFHAFPRTLPGGFAGVDVFFVISGFLIGGLIFDGLDAGTFCVRHFYARRIRRLFPSLITVLLATLLLGWLILLPSEYGHLGRHTAGGAAFVANVLSWREAGYFDIASANKPLLHLWSLGVEEQFYLLGPLAAIALWRCPRRYRLCAVWVFLLASFGLNLVLLLEDPITAFFSPLTRFWELLAGVQLALWSRLEATDTGASVWWWLPHLCARHGLLVSAIGLTLVVSTFFTLSETNAFLGWWLALPVSGTVMLLATTNHSPINSRWLASAPLVFVGLISYSLYLWHWPLLALLNIIEDADAAPALRLATIIIAVVLASATWRFLETPLRRSRASATVPCLLAAGIVIGIAGATVNLQDGLPQRVARQTEQLRSLAWGPEMNAAQACLSRFRQHHLSYCLESAPGAQPDIALLGDSAANQYFWALKEHYAKHGMNLLNLGRTACPVLRDVETTRHDRDSCVSISKHVLDEIVATPSIKTVILANRWSRDIAGGLIHARRPTQRDPVAILREGLEATVAELLRAGKRVVILSATPELPYPATSCIRARPFYFSDRTERDRCAIPRAAAEQQAATYRGMLSVVKERYPSLTLVDPTNALCDAHWCYGKADEKLLYRDIHHLSSAGAEFVIRKIFAEILGTERDAVDGRQRNADSTAIGAQDWPISQAGAGVAGLLPQALKPPSTPMIWQLN